MSGAYDPIEQDRNDRENNIASMLYAKDHLEAVSAELRARGLTNLASHVDAAIVRISHARAYIASGHPDRRTP